MASSHIRKAAVLTGADAGMPCTRKAKYNSICSEAEVRQCWGRKRSAHDQAQGAAKLLRLQDDATVARWKDAEGMAHKLSASLTCQRQTPQRLNRSKRSWQEAAVGIHSQQDAFHVEHVCESTSEFKKSKKSWPRGTTCTSASMHVDCKIAKPILCGCHEWLQQ